MISSQFITRWTSLALSLRRGVPSRCNIHTTCGMSSSSREARFMNKIMNRHKSKSKMYFFDQVGGPSSPSSVCRTPNQRRMSVLNKLFMKNITEVLATGRSSLNIEGLGIEICKVSISPDFQNVNVLYVSKTVPTPENLDDLLVEAAFSLRHELSQLRLMGEVPRINFLEDKTLKKLNEIQNVLAIADKGSDDHSEEIDKMQEEEIETFNESQRAYGLNHDRIFNKIVTAKRASSFHKRQKDTLTIQEGVQYSVPNSPQTQETLKEKPQRMISQFLKERKSATKQRSE